MYRDTDKCRIDGPLPHLTFPLHVNHCREITSSALTCNHPTFECLEKQAFSHIYTKNPLEVKSLLVTLHAISVRAPCIMHTQSSGSNHAQIFTPHECEPISNFEPIKCREGAQISGQGYRGTPSRYLSANSLDFRKKHIDRFFRR